MTQQPMFAVVVKFIKRLLAISVVAWNITILTWSNVATQNALFSFSLKNSVLNAKTF